MKAPLILIPLELLQSIKPEGNNAPKFWFGDRVSVATEQRFGVIYGVDYRPAEVFPHHVGWWYRVRFDGVKYDALISIQESLISLAEWAD